MLKNMSISCMLLLALSVPHRNEVATGNGLDYALYAKVLKTYVDDHGRVDYEGLKKNRKEFDQFISQIETTDLSVLSELEQKTFWINAYNAITMKVILDKYPVKSIRSINFGLVWEVPRKVARQKRSLGYIEHKILRPMGDPRIHFAINCASIGCPNLPQEPLYPDQLEQQLDRETRKFINDPEKIRLDKNSNTLYFSSILDWFEEDFLVVAPDILGYITLYVNDADRRYLSENQVTLKEIKYNWNLNKQ